MLNDITFGQYLPTGSFLHKTDARTKILLLVLWIVILFLAGNFYALGACAVLVLLFMLVSKISLKMYLRNIKAVWLVIVFTSIINALYVRTGRVLFSFWVITVTTDGISRALFMSLRIILLILLSAMFTYTTKPTEITDALESLLSPLRLFGLKEGVHILAMTMTIALRFIPTLIDETNKIMSAQKARGADFESGSMLRRIKAMLPILIPLLISSVRRAYELAEAMESRCYNGAEGRTKFKTPKLGLRDAVSAVVCALALLLIILINHFC
ncbi:MAG: energy-coupling factor transporter transmembrane protein EcfT [Clostridia bacterium]|nr:energy-coupling factor transporter transmembrane protein EcfT [Clostridia bacterium]MBQ7289058.1 energy-coupling factor transporter transmembrane protein EcfT [Clostridia bacterium]